MMPRNESIEHAVTALTAATAAEPATAVDLIISAQAHLRGALRDLGGRLVPSEVRLDRWHVRRAPIGSLTMASHCSNTDGRRASRACRRSGAITVGPVTIMIPPKTEAAAQPNPAT